ncbi:MAG: hypothetical protein U0452_03450 [Anaerolineae bacterium]
MARFTGTSPVANTAPRSRGLKSRIQPVLLLPAPFRNRAMIPDPNISL